MLKNMNNNLNCRKKSHPGSGTVCPLSLVVAIGPALIILTLGGTDSDKLGRTDTQTKNLEYWGAAFASAGSDCGFVELVGHWHFLVTFLPFSHLSYLHFLFFIMSSREPFLAFAFWVFFSFCKFEERKSIEWSHTCNTSSHTFRFELLPSGCCHLDKFDYSLTSLVFHIVQLWTTDSNLMWLGFC